MADQTTTPTPTPAEETSAQRMLREAMAALAAAQEAVKAEEKAKADAIAAEVATIEAELADLDAQIKPLVARCMDLVRRKETLVPPPALPTQATPQAAATSTSASGDKKWKTEKYMFWRAYQTAFKAYADTASHSQAVLTETCKRHNISQTVPDVATLNRVRDILTRTTR